MDTLAIQSFTKFSRGVAKVAMVATANHRVDSLSNGRVRLVPARCVLLRAPGVWSALNGVQPASAWPESCRRSGSARRAPWLLARLRRLALETLAASFVRWKYTPAKSRCAHPGRRRSQPGDHAHTVMRSGRGLHRLPALPPAPSSSGHPASHKPVHTHSHIW